MKTSLDHIVGDIFELEPDVILDGCEAAKTNDRKRIILPIHRTDDASVQRMLNFLQPGTFIRPHRHPVDGAIETILVLQGRLGFIIFDENGSVDRCCDLLGVRSGGLGLIDIEPNVWHGMVALSPDTVVLEIKQGPYDFETDKEFAHWAPVDDTNEAHQMVETFESLFA